MPNFQAMRSKTKTKTNHTLWARFFPRFEQVTGNCWEFWLVHRVVCPCDWSKQLFWYWFFDSRLKTTLTSMKPALCTEEHCMIRYPKVISRHVGRYSRKLMIEITSAYAREGNTTKILRFPGRHRTQDLWIACWML